MPCCMESISLWLCPGGINSCHQLICLVGFVVLSSSGQNSIGSLWLLVSRVFWPIKHSDPKMIKAGTGNSGISGQCNHSSKISMALDLMKHNRAAPADDMALKIITDCGKFTLDLKLLRLCASPLFVLILGSWFPHKMQNVLWSKARTLEHWATAQSFPLSPR